MIRSKSDHLVFSRKGIVGLICLSLLSAAIFGMGSVYLHDTVSLSASYTAEQRKEANLASLERVKEMDADLRDEEIVTIVESAFSPFLSGNTTWTVGVYRVDAEELAKKPESFSGFWGYSKSKAAADPALIRLYTAEIVTDGKGKVLSFEMKETAQQPKTK